MVAAGLGADLLLANEVLDASRIGVLVAAGARVTVAVDSVPTIEAAAAGGPVPSDEEMAGDVEAYEMAPLFDGEALERI